MDSRRTGRRVPGVAMLSVVGALTLSAALEAVIPTHHLYITSLLLLVAVGLAAIYGGLASGVMALVLGSIASWFLFIPPRYSFAAPAASGYPELGFAALAAAGIAVLGAALRRARLRADAAAREASARGERLEREIAARQRAQEAQRRTEERYRTPADQVKDYAIFIADDQGRNRSWNEGIRRLLGYDKAEFLEASIADLFTSEDRAAGVPERELAEATARGKLNAERWLLRRDGTRFWASVSTTSVQGRQGQLLGFAMRLRDLSEMKEVEEELRRNQEALELAYDAAGLGTWDHDLIAGELRWDTRAKALFGLPPDAAITAQGWAELIHPADLGPTEELRDRALRERRPFSAEFRVIWADGSVHWIAAIGRGTFDPITGDPLRMTGILLDITERKATEERLQEVLRLEAIGRLAGGIAHDLNNMLGAILGFSDFLAQSLGPGDPRRADVEQIVRAAGRSAALTKQLLTFARRELIQPRRVDLNVIVRGTESILRPVLGENVKLVVHLAPTEGVIYADPSRLEQIVMNLVLNARDAMPQGGQVTVQTATLDLESAPVRRQAQVEVPPPGRYVTLTVSDTGHGMDPATLQRIWEPFFTTKPKGQGTGLGLSTVYGSVKQSGGFVWADSEPGKGTAIQVFWPEIRAEPEQLGEAREPRAIKGGTETILIVEDEPVLRALSERTLTSLGYRCFAAQGGEEALRWLEQEGGQINLVITDVVMPGMSGGGLGEQLALQRPGVPVLYISGFTDEDVIRRGLLGAGRPFLQKPFTPNDLARKVREVLDEAASGRRQQQTA